MTLLPASAFLEIVMYSGNKLGCDLLHELTFQTPLVVGQDETQIQVLVGELDEQGRRGFSVHSRPRVAADDDRLLDGAPTCHASGFLMSDDMTSKQASPYPGEQWPPPGAVELNVEGLYDELLQRDLEYGPSFQGTRRAWRLDEDVLAEVSLAEPEIADAPTFGVHPALLDAALHATALTDDADGCSLPISLSAVKFYKSGSSSLRVRISPQGDNAISLRASDGDGAPVAEIGLLEMRAATREQLLAARRDDSLFRLDWAQIPLDGAAHPPLASDGWATIDRDDGWLASTRRPTDANAHAYEHAYESVSALAEAVSGGAPTPEVVLAGCPRSLVANDLAASDVLADAHAATLWALELIQRWLAEDVLVDSRLVLITHDATVAQEGDRLDGVALAPIWGLARAAQAEHPGRIVVVDLQGESCSWDRLAGAVDSGEPQLAVRDERVFIPRLKQMTSDKSRTDAPAGQQTRTGETVGGEERFATSQIDLEVGHIDPTRTVLITGGTGGLGGLIAKHLVERYGARRLLLTSRGGERAKGAAQLTAELARMGAQATVHACDVSDRAQVEALLNSVPVDWPLGAVIHAAGVLDDGVIEAMTADRVMSVLRPKVDGAVHLDELTRDIDLSAFVMFSSAAATIGAPGQSNYSAANAFLDALVARRRAQGLVGLSMGWGLWQAAGMGKGLNEAARSRLSRMGLGAVPLARALDLFDVSLAGGHALVLPMTLEVSALRAQARAGTLAPVFRGLIRVPARRAQDDQRGTLETRLAGASDAERARVVLDLTLAHTATVLAYDSADVVEPLKTFKDLGFDSLSAVELRNRLSSEVGFTLPATLVFDYPTPESLSQYLLAQLLVKPDDAAVSLDAELGILERRLSTIASTEGARAKLLARLRAFMAGLDDGQDATTDEDVHSAGAEEVFKLIDREFGSSEQEGDARVLG
jgi:NADP-dependent 3-hydroxy acid dehydrogenase YdfG/acyl carrier protein